MSYKKFERKADKLWREEIHRKWKDKCAICARTGKLDAHHYIGRRNKTTRWYLPNGILLCAGCHTFAMNSAHQNPEAFRAKMLVLLSPEWLKDLVFQSNKIWDKNQEKVLAHLNRDRDDY